MPVDGMMVGVSRGRGAVVLLVVGGVLGAVPSVAGCAGGQSGATGEIVGGVYQWAVRWLSTGRRRGPRCRER